MYIYQSYDLLANAISNCVEWFILLLAQIGGFGPWISSLVVVIAFKFLFRPIFGYASSDLARNSYNAFKRRKEE